jgi:hypothetical protein
VTAVNTATPVVIPPSPTATSIKTPTATPTTTMTGKARYVDNSVLVSGDGSSWDKSWKSFSLINWNTINPGDTIYISGGSNSQIYYETLIISKSGASGKYISIDVGANSPSPLGHDGTVIIDGGGVRTSGIYSYGMSYININGRDSGNNYKLLVRNAVTTSDGDANVLIRNGDHINVDYLKIICNTSRGIFFFYMTNGRVRGNDIRTGAVNNTYQTDNIYVGRGFDNVVENNILYNTNAITTESHNDPIQVGSEGRLIVRNNYIESTYDADSIIIGDAKDWIYAYNNVAKSEIRQLYGSPILVYAENYTGAVYLFNNTIISSNYNSGHGIELYQGSDSAIGAIKNNIIYTTNEDGIKSDYPITTPAKIDNNCYYNAGGQYASDINSTGRTWAQHQAAGFDVHGINANPLFINNFADLHLQSASPCRNIGADLSAYFTTDIDGVIRRIGSWDAGAYQSQP